MADNALLAPLLDTWDEDPQDTKTAFMDFYNWLHSQADVKLEMVARPGISYSLRATNTAQKERPVFALVDVVDDDPAERWLSVCFYNDMITDPDELGDFVPQGLLGQDALCLNLDEKNPAMQQYILSRLQEAARNAGRY